MFLMFLGPLDHGGDFTDQGIGGIKRFLNRAWQLVHTHADILSSDTPEPEHRRLYRLLDVPSQVMPQRRTWYRRTEKCSDKKHEF